jgi:hypothetical protein
MIPRRASFAPRVLPLHRTGRPFPPNYPRDSWLEYLYRHSQAQNGSKEAG